MEKTDHKITKIYFLSLLLILIIFNSLLVNAKEIIYLSDESTHQNKIAVVTIRSYALLNDDSILLESKINEKSQLIYLTAYHEKDEWKYNRSSSLLNLLDQTFKYENWLIFVHGDGKDLTGAVQRAKEIQKLHQVNVLVYAWPSLDSELGAIKNFKNSYTNVEKGTLIFSQFLKQIHKIKSIKNHNFSNGSVSILLHSLGNYYLENLVENNLHQSFTIPFIDNLIINAAAVEQKEHNQWVEQLAFQKRIYINSNGKDINLIGLRIFSTRNMQLGEDPKPPFAANAFYVNFTDAVGASIPPGPSHSYFFASVTDESKRIKDYYTELFNGIEINFNDSGLFDTNSKNYAYTIRF